MKLKGLDLTTPEKVATFRARDVRALLQGTNTDPKVIKCLEALAENNVDAHMHIKALADALNQMVDIVASFAVIAENMKQIMSVDITEGPVV